MGKNRSVALIDEVTAGFSSSGEKVRGVAVLTIFSFSPVGQSGNIRPEKRRRNRNPGRMRRRRRRRRDYMQAKRRIRAGGVRSVFQKREIRKGDDRLRAEYA